MNDKPSDEITLDDLQRAGLVDLERLYATPSPCDLPRGCYRGVVLRRLRNRAAQRLGNRLILRLGFETFPFGVDFRTRCWYFFDPRYQIGRFRPEPHRSRWRESEVIGLHYEVSALPGFVRTRLYDEVKPLNDRLCLGIIGLNFDRGEGDLSFIALQRHAWQDERLGAASRR